MPSVTIEVRAADGAACAVEIHTPAVPRPRAPVLLCLPAMGVAASYYRPFAQHLGAATGGVAALADLRGQGMSSVRARRGADFGYREILELDLPALVDALACRYAAHPLYIAGHSLGGQLGALFAVRDRRVAGIALIASGTAHYRSWPDGQRRKAMLAVRGIRLAAALLPYYPGTILGFGGEQPRRLMRDWGLNATTGRYRPEHGAVDYDVAPDAARLRVLSIEIEQDPIAPSGAVEELLGKLGAAQVTRRRVPGVVQDPPRRRHFSWARQPGEIAALIGEWLAPPAPAMAPMREEGAPRPAEAARR